jgi:hypothetical protein
LGAAFQLDHVATGPHRAFVEAFAARSNFDYQYVNGMVIFTPRTPANAILHGDPMTFPRCLSKIFPSKGPWGL